MEEAGDRGPQPHLSQCFSLRASTFCFLPKGTLGNVWRRFGLSQLAGTVEGRRCY